MAVVKVSREIGGRTLSLETGQIGKLASACVIAQYGGSVVLAAVVRAKPREGIDFFPLTVDYRERTAAAGKFPGGFRKREGAPNEKEILTMRMIDRPIRPLFPDGFVDEILIQVWVMSHDGENDTDVLAGTAASASGSSNIAAAPGVPDSSTHCATSPMSARSGAGAVDCDRDVASSRARNSPSRPWRPVNAAT